MGKKELGIVFASCLFILQLFPRLSLAEESSLLQQPQYQEYQPYHGPGIEFSLKLFGGGSYFLLDDINDNLKGLTDMWDDDTDYDVIGEFEQVKMGYEFGGEFIINITPQVGIGLGAGYIQASKKSSVENTLDGNDYEDTANPKITAIPLTLGLHLRFPGEDTINFIINAGVDYYSGKIKWNYNWEGPEDSYEENWEAKSNTIGYHGGLGFEFNLGSNVDFVIEGIGRYVKFKDLSGEFNSTYRSPDLTETETVEDAVLWYGNFEAFGNSYPQIAIDDEGPSGASWRNVRKGEIDLSGFSVRAGFKIKF